jgi:hypothetical protein
MCLLQEGLRGFFRSSGVDILRSIPSSGIGYLSYEYYKSYMMTSLHYKRDSKVSNVAVRLIAGGTLFMTDSSRLP